MGPFDLGDRAFDSDVINLFIVISSLPFVIEVSVGAFDDCKDCAMSGKGINLLWRLTDLQWRWWRWIGF
jgi:hypothetical protein